MDGWAAQRSHPSQAPPLFGDPSPSPRPFPHASIYPSTDAPPLDSDDDDDDNDAGAGDGGQAIDQVDEDGDGMGALPSGVRFVVEHANGEMEEVEAPPPPPDMAVEVCMREGSLGRFTSVRRTGPSINRIRTSCTRPMHMSIHSTPDVRGPRGPAGVRRGHQPHRPRQHADGRRGRPRLSLAHLLPRPAATARRCVRTSSSSSCVPLCMLDGGGAAASCHLKRAGLTG